MRLAESLTLMSVPSIDDFKKIAKRKYPLPMENVNARKDASR
jgi:hypothetical protein